MFRSLAICGSLQGNVGFGFHRMMLDQQRSQIAFPVLAAVDEGNRVIRLPALAGMDQPSAAALADAAIAIEHAEPNAGRNAGVRRCANPFIR